MSSQNAQIYYENEANHGSYVYVSLEEMVRNFMENYTGDGKILRKAKRSQVIYHFKQGIKKFSMNALKEVKAVELELGDTLDIILPPDYVNYVRISYVNSETGDLMVLSINDKVPLATAYLQDHNADILFDDQGFVLEGTTYMSSIVDKPQQRTFDYTNCVNHNYDLERKNVTDPTKNANGTFNIDTRSGRIHFSSDNASRVLMLEYISDGLEYSNESDIKVNKKVEMALMFYVNYHLMAFFSDIPMYEKREARRLWESEYTNAKIAMMNLKLSDLSLWLNAKRQAIK